MISPQSSQCHSEVRPYAAATLGTAIGTSRLSRRLVTSRVGLDESPLYIGEEMDLSRNYLPQMKNLPHGINYTLVSNAGQKHFQVKLHIRDTYDDREGFYTYLRERRSNIESQVGGRLDWTQNEGLDTVILQRDGDVRTREAWDGYLDWLIKYGEAFDTVFGTHIQEFER